MKKTFLFSSFYLCLCAAVLAQDYDTSSSANDYMHQSSHEELVKMFDSSERDDWQKPDEVIGFLGDINGKTIVDVGSGSGYFTFRLLHAGANVVAADVDEEFLEVIEGKRAEASISEDRLKTVLIDEHKLNIEDNSADIVFLVNVYHHISDRIPYFSAVNRTLKESGKIVIVDFYKKSMSIGPSKSHKIAKEVVSEELQEAGYSTIEMDTTLLDYQYIITAQKY